VERCPGLRFWLVAGLVSVLILWLAARGAPLGVPVADDYDYLRHQRFVPFSFFDAFGFIAKWYWRPVSRQLYFMALGPFLLHAPWVAVVLHALLLVAMVIALGALLTYFGWPRRAALVAATFPVLVEAARVLLAWPSSAQHLLAMTFCACAVLAAARGAAIPSLLAVAAALGSIETAVFVVPAAICVFPARGRARFAWAALALAAVWAAVRFGVLRDSVPPGALSPSVARMLITLRRGIVAQLGLEDLARMFVVAAVAGYALALLGAWRTSRAAAATRAQPARWALGGIAWWVAGTLSLAGLGSDWNAWRSCLPSLGLGVAFGSVFTRSGAWPVALFLAVRVGVLLLAPPAPAGVSPDVPATASHMSFIRFVRLQRTAEAVRHLLDEMPRPPRGVTIRYWNYPRLTEMAFAGPHAVQVWLGDSTARWEPFGEAAGLRDTSAIVVAFDPGGERLAVRLDPDAQRFLLRADDASRVGDLAAADRWLERVLVAQHDPPPRLRALVLRSRFVAHLQMGSYRTADSLHHAGSGIISDDDWRVDERAIALALRDTARALRADGSKLR
jgi:hypothetical protein